MTTETPALNRDELVSLVAKAHLGSARDDSAAAGKTLASASRLPGRVAENLGAGLGQWDFFPEPAEIVDFALAYVPPANEDELWTLTRTWAADDAAGRKTMLVLVGKDILQHEARRLDVAKLRELFDEAGLARSLVLRAQLGLAVPPAGPVRGARGARAPKVDAKGAPGPKPGGDIPIKMPKPEFKKPVKAPPPPPARRFSHPKFGEGSLEASDGNGQEAKLTIKFAGGTKTLLAKFVTEVAITGGAPVEIGDP